MSREFLSVKEIHEATGISTDAVRGAIERGELRASKVANRVIVHVDDFRAWTRDNVVAPRRRERPARRAKRASGRPARGSLAALHAIEEGGGK